jgi:hypothetical protein
MRSLSSRREQYVSGVADKIPAAQNIKVSTSNPAERPGVLRADARPRKLYDVLAGDAASQTGDTACVAASTKAMSACTAGFGCEGRDK